MELQARRNHAARFCDSEASMIWLAISYIKDALFVVDVVLFVFTLGIDYAVANGVNR